MNTKQRLARVLQPQQQKTADEIVSFLFDVVRAMALNAFRKIEIFYEPWSK
jgi:hypothetical protein